MVNRWGACALVDKEFNEPNLGELGSGFVIGRKKELKIKVLMQLKQLVQGFDTAVSQKSQAQLDVLSSRYS
jgi:hypothetical protein